MWTTFNWLTSNKQNSDGNLKMWCPRVGHKTLRTASCCLGSLTLENRCHGMRTHKELRFPDNRWQEQMPLLSGEWAILKSETPAPVKSSNDISPSSLANDLSATLWETLRHTAMPLPNFWPIERMWNTKYVGIMCCLAIDNLNTTSVITAIKAWGEKMEGN